MARILYFNRTRETVSGTPGTSVAITNDGAALGHVTLTSHVDVAVGDTFYYLLEDQDAPENWEIGLGTKQSGETWDRTTVLDNSLGTKVKINFVGANIEFVLIWSAEAVDDLRINEVSKIVANSTSLVDVVIYDTAKDTDLGAWRKKTRRTSWYNEALGTATRGLTKEFPRTALIVAETNVVTIYDLDDPDVPMWMVFNTFGETATVPRKITALGGQSGALTSTHALNGIICITGGGTFVSQGLLIWDFIEDFFGNYSGIAEWSGRTAGTLAGRNTQQVLLENFPTIVSSLVNDVAITALAGAETDPNRLDLPFLTIGVATDGGVSVINPDGSLAKINTVNDSFDAGTWGSISFDATTADLWAGRTSANQLFRWTDYSADNFSLNQFYSNATTPNITSTFVDIATFSDQIAAGGSAGLVLLDYDNITKENGMVARVAKDFATGWMQGDIELALSDSLTDRSGTGTAVVDNGTAVVAAIAPGAEQKKITTSGGTLTATVTTGGAIYGWELISGTWIFRAGTGWVGVSESAGTLTVADATTFAMLRYTNGAGPSAVQFTNIEEDEKWVTRENSEALLAGISDAVAALSFDNGTDLLFVGTGDGTSVFQGLERIDQIDNSGILTSDTIKAVAGRNSHRAIATAAEVSILVPEKSLKEIA